LPQRTRERNGNGVMSTYVPETRESNVNNRNRTKPHLVEKQ
jgi:hypothetical protein